MILSQNYEDINSIYDFYEGIISDIFWDNNFADLVVVVYYFFDQPIGLKNKDVVIRFKKCSTFNFDCTNMISAMKRFNIARPHPEIDLISLKKDSSCITVKISTNYDDPMITLSCDEIWIELI